jgi:hypothetical protein
MKPHPAGRVARQKAKARRENHRAWAVVFERQRALSAEQKTCRNCTNVPVDERLPDWMVTIRSCPEHEAKIAAHLYDRPTKYWDDPEFR